ncbi:hypothetical protein ACJJIF_16660 [Microbulbifer sp. SSSA002]|uniref:hypothetical protein n=1 Tax=unclassified Microbulbifer TaxID=2619833 RepID=UPI00403A53BB
MRYLVSMVLLCSLAGFSFADDRMTSLPANAEPVQILGKTYYQSGNNFYAFNEQGRFFYQVQPPTSIRNYERPKDMSVRGSQSHSKTWGLTRDQVEGCMNSAADMANANPAVGGKVYIREYNLCINNLR